MHAHGLLHFYVMKNENWLLKSKNFIPVFLVYREIFVLFIHDSIAAKIIASINKPSKNYFYEIVQKDSL